MGWAGAHKLTSCLVVGGCGLIRSFCWTTLSYVMSFCATTRAYFRIESTVRTTENLA